MKKLYLYILSAYHLMNDAIHLHFFPSERPQQLMEVYVYSRDLKNRL